MCLFAVTSRLKINISVNHYFSAIIERYFANSEKGSISRSGDANESIIQYGRKDSVVPVFPKEKFSIPNVGQILLAVSYEVDKHVKILVWFGRRFNNMSYEYATPVFVNSVSLGIPVVWCFSCSDT